MTALELDTASDELYGAPLGEFISTRNALEKQAKAAGDRDLAASIHRLVKPSATAWLANQLVRRHRDDLEPLLELGAGLRAAMASLSGPELRKLGQQQHRLIAALVDQAGALAQEDGRRVSVDTARSLEQTLHAALADESTAQTLLEGRLTDALLDSGFATGPGSVGSARGTKPTKAAPTRASTNKRTSATNADAARREAVARAEHEKARAALEAAVAAHDLAEDAAGEAETALDDTVARIARLREELDQATSDKTRLEREHYRLRADAARTERAVRGAAHRLDACSDRAASEAG